VLQLTRAPVIASHSGVRALVENTRNLSDAEIDAIGRNGGVISVPAFNAYLRKPGPDVAAKVAVVRGKYGLPPVAAGQSNNDGYPTLPADKQASFNAEITAAVGRASVSDLVDQIDYLVKRIGIEHVGIGTDFDHGSGIVGFENEADAGNVTRELVRRGYTEEQIGRIWSGNFLRVLKAVEAAKRKS
jgi:membrane dipeptidase